MAKFIKLEDGTYLNVDHIITIDDHVARMLGFDSEWAAHSVELTGNDLKRVLAATDSSEISQVSNVAELAVRDPHTLVQVLSALELLTRKAHDDLLEVRRAIEKLPSYV